MTRWVVDASPLIFLAKLNHLELLRRGAAEVYVPPKVLDEVRAWADSPATVIDHASKNWLRVRAPRRDVASPGTGEAAAIALALDLGADRVVLVEAVLREAGEIEPPEVTGT